ncbi:MAG: cyclic dehypoxanthinyl futalosine synthase [Ktedonobacteraceae bacterium]
MQTLTNTPDIINKVLAGERLSLEEGLRLFQESNLDELGTAAETIRQRRHPDGVVTFLVDRNINYTNVCIIDCGFCAFYRKPASPEGYLLTNEQIGKKIEELIAWGGTRILLQGGVHPYLKLDYYVDLLHYIKQHYEIQIDAFSPIEVQNIARIMKRPQDETLHELHLAGMDGLPGGGAEILDDHIRMTISPHKGSWREWINSMRLAQREGMTTSATMVFGFGETTEERIQHLLRLRELQDESMVFNGNGFTSFICWGYQPENTKLGGKRVEGEEYLRMVAVARLMLDNFDNLSASWPSHGVTLAKKALRYGANDFGSTMMEENVVSAAGSGTGTCQTPEGIIGHIRKCGFKAAKRDSRYRVLERY